MEYRLPELGENVESATIVRWLVEPGGELRAGEPIVELETGKAVVELPAETSGKVDEVVAPAGAEVRVGQLMLRYSAVETAAASVGADVAPAEQMAPAPPAPVPTSAARAPVRALSPSAPATGSAQPVRTADAVVPSGNGDRRAPIPAGPATRRLARELGVDLALVKGTARGGRITVDDIKTYVRGNGGRAAPPVAGAPDLAQPSLPDFEQWGPVERVRVGAVRRATAEHLSLASRIVPSVTQYDLADITDLEAGRKRLVASLPPGSPRVTMTVLVLKALVAALRAYPRFNSSYDAAASELILKRYMHIGVAVDTDHGLFVPVIRDVDRKPALAIAAELTELAERARRQKLTPDEMRGGCFTLTNLGGIGGTAFSPIVNYPEVAILGLARSQWQQIVRDGKPEIRLMLPLCLTYDHRVLDGADGVRFTTFLGQLLSDPVRLLVEG